MILSLQMVEETNEAIFKTSTELFTIAVHNIIMKESTIQMYICHSLEKNQIIGHSNHYLKLYICLLSLILDLIVEYYSITYEMLNFRKGVKDSIIIWISIDKFG